MTGRDLAYWLQGFFEITEAQSGATSGLTAQQVDCIKKHLALVFKHEIDPSYGDKDHQKELNEIHNGGAKPSKFPPYPNDGKIYRC